jgi:hypothetical protein
MKRSFLFTSLLLATVTMLAGCAHPPFYSAKEIHGQIVDAATGEPIEGVVIVAQWELFQEGLGDSGHKGSMVNIKEAVTDSTGNYVIPGWWPRPRLPFNYLDNRDPKLSIFKSGYFPEELFNPLRSEEHINHDSMRTSQWDGKVIRLKKFNDDFEKYTTQLVSLRIGLAGDGYKLRSYPRMFFALAAEQQRLKTSGPKLRYNFSVGPIEDLNESDQKFLREYKFASISTYAYEIKTHKLMSDKALTQSKLKDYLPSLGLNSLKDKQVDLDTTKLVDINFSKTISEWVQLGADNEDDTFSTNFARYRNHFYDPTNDKGLNGGNASGEPSPDWGLEDTKTYTTQSYSFKDARQSFYDALTLPNKDNREMWMARTFYTLGHIIHLVQDLAQPQHTRNDSHGGMLIFGTPSVYEHYTDDHRGQLNYAGYDWVMFNTPRQFWTTDDGRGLAEFSNSNFVTAGTNFDSGKYASPVIDPAYTEIRTAEELCLEMGSNCPKVFVQNPTATMTFYGNVIVDNYQPLLATFNKRASTDSIFNSDLTFAGSSPIFTLNSLNFDAAHAFLIKRAVGYSSGLIDYFFRGKMEISLPDEGVYSVLDHNDLASNAKDTGGFTKIKLKIQNLTPRGAGIEPMGLTGGKLKAVVKFHRNNCYVSDLSGEYGSPGMDWNTCREKDEEIVVSSEIDAPLGIDDVHPSRVTFMFPTPIPINATDLFLQVVYQGPLGDEPKAVVVATKDISEPSYIFNYGSHLWDQFTYGSAWPVVSAGTGTYAWWCSTGFSTIDACNQAMGSTIKLQFMPTASYAPGYDPAIVAMGQWIDRTEQPTTLSPVATLVAPIGSFARIAVLMDAQPANYVTYVTEKIDTTHDARSPPGVFMWLGGIMSPTINQQDPITKNLIPSVKYIKARGVFLPDYATEVLDNFSPFVLIPSQISPDW